jgi:hypothetical protein
MSYQEKYQKYKLKYLSLKQLNGGNPEDDYVQFIESAEGRHFLDSVNSSHLKNTSPQFIQKLKETLLLGHIDKPHLHKDELASSLDTKAIGMMPGSEYSTIPDEFQASGKKYLEVVSALNPGVPYGSIGHFTQYVLSKLPQMPSAAGAAMVRQRSMTSPEDDYVKFIKSVEGQHFLDSENSSDLKNISPQFIQKLKETLLLEHIDKPTLHKDELAYSLDTKAIGMMPGSEYSTIRDEFRASGKKYLEVVSALNPRVPPGSIGHFIQHVLSKL